MTMWGVSRGLMLFPLHSALLAECRALVAAFLGRQAASARDQAVAFGTDHALGARLRTTRSGVDVVMPQEFYDRVHSPEAQLMALMAHDGERQRRSEAFEGEAVAKMEATRAKAKAARATKQVLREHNEVYVHNHWFVPALVRAVEEPGATEEQLERGLGTPPGHPDVFRRVPPIDVMLTTTVARDSEWSRKIDLNDGRDQAWMYTALPYCDLVVMERYWGGVVNRTGLGQRLGTTVYTDIVTALRDLEQA